LAGGNQSTRRKPATLPLCPPQIPHDLTWALVSNCIQKERKTLWGWGRSSYPINSSSNYGHILVCWYNCNAGRTGDQKMYRPRHFFTAPKPKFTLLFMKVKVSDTANTPEQMLLLSRACQENKSSQVVWLNLEDIL
jgi:hypothetical protein